MTNSQYATLFNLKA